MNTSHRFVAALAAVLALTGCASAAVPAAAPATKAAHADPTLVGTEWQLASYQDPGTSAPVPVTIDSTLQFSNGGYGAHACNYLGGTAVIAARTITADFGSSTAMACGGQAGTLEREVTATMTGSVGWSIADDRLTLTGADGHRLVYRVRPSIYPDLTAHTVVAGNLAGGQYRLAVDYPVKGNDHYYLTFEERSAPGSGWGQASIASPGTGDCLADSVLGAAGTLGGQTFVAAWATSDVARVTMQVRPGSPELVLRIYPVAGTSLRIVGLWTKEFHNSSSLMTFYDKAGQVIAGYPKGPC